MRKLLSILFILFLLTSCQREYKRVNYLTQKRNFKTNLSKHIKSPRPWDEIENENGFKKVFYKSGGIDLKAYLDTTNIQENKKTPAIVYFHGGFALERSDLEACDLFVKAGFVVLAPTFRAENGNPGNFEFHFGEVDDAVEAIKWLAKKPFVDSTQVFVFGHSAGANNAGLITLYENIPIRFSGGCNGLETGEFVIVRELLGGNLPFEFTREEGNMRAFIEHVEEMNYDYYAYISTDDSLLNKYKNYYPYFDSISAGTRLNIDKTIVGDHFNALFPSIAKYIELIKLKTQEN